MKIQDKKIVIEKIQKIFKDLNQERVSQVSKYAKSLFSDYDAKLFYGNINFNTYVAILLLEKWMPAEERLECLTLCKTKTKLAKLANKVLKKYPYII